MTYETLVPGPEWTGQGLVLPEVDAVLSGVVADFQAAFGNRLNFFGSDGRFLLSRPQGQLATSWAASVVAAQSLLAYYVNQVDPDFAEGRMQEAIGRIYFMERIAARATIVEATCAGVPGTFIPAGALARDVAGNIYASTAAAVIGSSGMVMVDFQCTSQGPVECPPGSLNSLYEVVAGWDSIHNERAGIPGRNEESRAEFEERRRKSVASGSINSMDAIYASVMAVRNVVDVYVTENPTGETVLKGGVSLKPHSVYVCVAGGSSGDIAQAIWHKKPPGCDMNGDITVKVTDTTGQYADPPVYDITYQGVKFMPVRMKVVLAQGNDVPEDAASQVREALYQAFYSGNRAQRSIIGKTLYASQFYCVLGGLGSWVRIVELLLGTDVASGQTVAVNIDTMATLEQSDIEVVIR